MLPNLRVAMVTICGQKGSFYLFILGFWDSVALGFRPSPAGPASLQALLERFVPYFMHIMKSQSRRKGEGKAQINLQSLIPQTKALEH